MTMKRIYNDDKTTAVISSVNSILVKKHKAKLDAIDYIQERLSNKENTYIIIKSDRTSFSPCNSHYNFKILDVYDMKEAHEIKNDESNELSDAVFSQYGYIDSKSVLDGSEKYRLPISTYGEDWVLYKDVDLKNTMKAVYSKFFSAIVKGTKDTFVGYLSKDNSEFHIVDVNISVVDDAYIFYQVSHQLTCDTDKRITGIDDKVRLNEQVILNNEDSDFKVTIVPSSKPDLLISLLTNE